jgi:hypothetical protein
MASETPRLVVSPEAPPDPQLASPSRQSWLSANLRNFVVIGLVLMVGYLAYIGNERAQEAIVIAFITLSGMLFGERAALKRPGQDG